MYLISSSDWPFPYFIKLKKKIKKKFKIYKKKKNNLKENTLGNSFTTSPSRERRRVALDTLLGDATSQCRGTSIFVLVLREFFLIGVLSDSLSFKKKNYKKYKNCK